jgi:hypothetical protein
MGKFGKLFGALLRTQSASILGDVAAFTEVKCVSVVKWHKRATFGPAGEE